MNEPQIQVSPDQLVQIIGQQHIELLILRNQVAQLKATIGAMQSTAEKPENVVPIKEPA